MKKILFFVMIVITTPVLMSCDKVGLLAQQRSLSDPPNPVRVEGIVTSLTTGKIIITDLVTGIVTSIDVNSIITPRYVKYTDGTIRKEHGGAAGDVISTYTLCRPASIIGGKPDGIVYNPGNTASRGLVHYFETKLGPNNVPISITFVSADAKWVGTISTEQWRTTPWYSGYYYKRTGGYSHGISQDNDVWRILETTF